MASQSSPDFVELTTFPAKSEVDMLAPQLEEEGIRTRVEEITAGERKDDFDSTISPRGAFRVLVDERHLEKGREVLERFESDREDARRMNAVEREPQRIEPKRPIEEPAERPRDRR
ncbi:MAG: hypothetical protein ACF8PN_03380 [Phycisphaerales bacterium]